MLSSPDRSRSFHFDNIFQNAKEKINIELTEGEVTGALGVLEKMGMIQPLSKSKEEFTLTIQGRHSNPWILQEALNGMWRRWGEQHGGRGRQVS